MPKQLTHEQDERIDAWVCAIRNMARSHGVAHKASFSKAVAAARKRLSTESFPDLVRMSFTHAVSAGIPEEELIAVRTLLFG
jgi:hypothetical protein